MSILQDRLRSDDTPVQLIGVGALPVDLPRAERAVRELLIALGENPDREGLAETPRRVAASFAEQVLGLRSDPGRHLRRTFANGGYDGVVIVRDIPFTSLCEHHLLPFHGKAHIAYLPRHGRVVGLSKLVRLVEGFARRPQLQEQLTTQIMDTLIRHLDPAGAAVVIAAEHSCMSVRGTKVHGAQTRTALRRGAFVDQLPQWPEVVGLITAP